ncbi:type II toxin-antitoxin system VapC family toxin [Microbacterium testaceum]|uniref:Ribonuclease VapC n=1 Tax=Microbacterium testaceum TaxID=2033 RepID=A0A2T7WMW7_MICTE|nr:PIN domain-containing protein [Microbacterium testaceum]PVE75415.1 VapC toxin family PIN domain ribonuclease [Microbacterium testaceum]
MIVLDAGVLIGFLDASDAHHAAAVNLMEQNPSGYLVHPLTAAEVLVGPAKRGVAERVWHDLRGVGVDVTILGPDEPLVLARLRARWGLKMPDTCVLATAERADVPLATFDRQLATAAAGAGRLLSHI